MPAQSPGRSRPIAVHAISLVELLVVIAIAGILLALTLPIARTVIGAAESARCKNSLRQLGMCFSAYLDDNRQFIPHVSGWTSTLEQYATDQQVAKEKLASVGHTITWGCPTYRYVMDNLQPSQTETGYGYQQYPKSSEPGVVPWSYGPDFDDTMEIRYTQINYKRQRSLIADSAVNVLHRGWGGDACLRHHGRTGNAIFFDYHIATHRSTDGFLKSIINAKSYHPADE